MEVGEPKRRVGRSSLDRDPPPDWIKKIDIEKLEKPPLSQTLRGVLVAAPGTPSGEPPVKSEIDVIIPAPPKPPTGNHVLRGEEFVGPETKPESILAGHRREDRLSPSPGGYRVRVKVGGTTAHPVGKPGKFRALYWLYWEPTATSRVACRHRPAQVRRSAPALTE